MSINKVILVGHCGKQAEVRNLQGGAKVATITLATTEKFKDREETEWHTITLWNHLAEVAEKYVQKGTQIYVEGKIKTEKYTGKDGSDRYSFRIVAKEMQLLGKKDSSQPQSSTPSPSAFQRAPLYQQVAQPVNDGPDDDMPF